MTELFNEEDKKAFDAIYYPNVDACARVLLAVMATPSIQAEEMFDGLMTKFGSMGFEPEAVLRRAFEINDIRMEMWRSGRPFFGGEKMQIPIQYQNNKGE